MSLCAPRFKKAFAVVLVVDACGNFLSLIHASTPDLSLHVIRANPVFGVLSVYPFHGQICVVILS